LSRRRRHSSVSARSRPQLDSYRRLSSTLIKFRRKGGFRSGISLGEAMASVRLSGNDSYTFHDLNVDSRGRIILKIRVRNFISSFHRALAEHLFWLFPIVVWILIDDLRDPRGRLRRPCAVDHFGTQDRACMCSFPPGKRMFPKHFSLLRRMSDEQPRCLVVQANMIPISWDRVLLYHLEETSVGVWQPVLSTS
jgi:hypothetical protein